MCHSGRQPTSRLRCFTTKRLACLIFLTVVHDGFRHMYEVLTVCFCNMLSLWQASNIILLVLLAKSKKYIRKQYFTSSSLWRIDSPYYSLRAIQERVHCRVFFLFLHFSEHRTANTTLTALSIVCLSSFPKVSHSLVSPSR